MVALCKMEVKSLLLLLAVAVGPAASWGARKRATSVLFEKFDARDSVVDPGRSARQCNVQALYQKKRFW